MVERLTGIARFLVFVLFLLVLFKSPAQANCTLEIQMDGAIGPASLDYLDRGLQRVKENKCDSLLILINTPGGSLQSTRLIVEEILNSAVPVLCLIHPSGARAGSAGAIIMQACHVNGALDATNIGAATPVAGGGKEIPKDLRKKLINDTISWIDGLTKLRGRNKEFGREIVTEAKAVSAKEAEEIGAIDFVVKTKTEFLEKAAGQKVKMAGDAETTVKVGALQRFDKDVRHKVVAFLTDPQIAYLVLMGSIGLLYFEITHPGMIVPGVIGGIGLIVSMVSLHKLNVTWGGLALMLLGILLMIAEAFVPSFGALGLGGVAAFFMGSLFLFDPGTTGIVLPMELIITTTAILGLAMLGIAYLAYSSFKIKRVGDYNELTGQEGRVVELTEGARRGLMHIAGETWRFDSDEDVQVGDYVRVNDHKGLTLKVHPRKSGGEKES